MKRMNCTTAVSIQTIAILALLAMVHDNVFAQSGSIKAPEHAHVKEYGSGCECNRGYLAVDVTCTATELPEIHFRQIPPMGEGGSARGVSKR